MSEQELLDTAKKKLFAGLKQINPMLKPGDISITIVRESEPLAAAFRLNTMLACKLAGGMKDVQVADAENTLAINLAGEKLGADRIIQVKDVLRQVSGRHISFTSAGDYLGFHGELEALANMSQSDFVRGLRDIPPLEQALSA